MIGFRVDANEKVATGHLMRCIAIANACKKIGLPCVFLLAEDKVTGRLVEHGIPYRILHTKWDDMMSEKGALQQIIKEEEIDYMVVDSYLATPSYLEWLNGMVPTMYVDDMAQYSYNVDAVLHYGQWEEDTSYQQKYKDTNTRVLCGMRYVPLREEFACESDRVREKSILITTGGTDPYNVTERLLQVCLGHSQFAEYTYHVIVGGMNQHEEQLKIIADMHPNVLLHKNINNMSEFMRRCEMAVSAGGTTLFELCACKIPTVCFSFADNQREFVEEMGTHRIMLCAGDARYENKIENSICNSLLEFMQNENMRRAYASDMKSLVDGHGGARIARFVSDRMNY